MYNTPTIDHLLIRSGLSRRPQCDVWNRVKAGLCYFAGRYCTDWKAKYGECDTCLKGGGRPFVITRECSIESGRSCMKNEETESVDCVKYCSSGKFFFHMASLQELFSSLVYAISFYLISLWCKFICVDLETRD